MKFNRLVFLSASLFLITIISIATANDCSCSFAVADFSSGKVRGLVSFSQDETGATEVAGIFSHGFDDTNADYGFQIIDECHEVLFDLSNELDITPDGRGATKSFRHKFDNMSVDCNDNGILTKKIYHSKRNGSCHSNKIRKRIPNGARTTQNGQGVGYAGLHK